VPYTPTVPGPAGWRAYADNDELTAKRGALLDKSQRVARPKGGEAKTRRNLQG